MTRSTSARGTEEWMRIIPTYSLGKMRSSPSALVALPRPMGSIPETPGSRVPLCPALSMPVRRLTQETSSWLVGPVVLSRGIRP